MKDQCIDKTMDICRWLLSMNRIEKTHRIKCYGRYGKKVGDLCFCFDRPGYGDCEGVYTYTTFLTIRNNFSLIIIPTDTNYPYLKQDRAYYRINGGDAHNLAFDDLKKHIIDAYCLKLKKFDLNSDICRT